MNFQLLVSIADLVIDEAEKFLEEAKGTTFRHSYHTEVEKSLCHTRLLLGRWYRLKLGQPTDPPTNQRNSISLPSPVNIRS